MKQLKLLLAFILLISIAGQAQNFRNRIEYMTTTDSSIHTIYTIPIVANEAGIINVSFVGYAQNNAGAVTSIQVVRYINAAGTITLGTPVAILATESDASVTGSSVAFSVSGSNIIVTVKSGRPVSVRWQVAISKESRVKNN
jgi:hypothetical protein